MRDSESHHICLDCSIDDDSINQWRVRGASGNGLSLLHPLQSWFSIRQNSSVKRHRSSLWNAQPVSADRCHLFADQLPPLSTAVLPTGYKSTIVPNGYERRVHRWLPQHFKSHDTTQVHFIAFPLSTRGSPPPVSPSPSASIFTQIPTVNISDVQAKQAGLTYLCL